MTKGGEVQNMITETFENALKQQVVLIKQLRKALKGFDNRLLKTKEVYNLTTKILLS
jgi:hypothetical protein